MTSTLHVGDCRTILATLPAESVQCCVCSPPYFGLRSYLPDGHPDKALEIGAEPSPQAYVDELVAVFRQVKRVLRSDGTVFLNLGDSYAGSWGNQGRKETRGTQRPINGGMLTPVLDGRYPSTGSNTGKIAEGSGLKPKDLCMIPARVALALQADGWWLRSEIVWAKSAPMPESVRDRPTCAHEKVFLLTKAANYFYDADAVREEYASNSIDRKMYFDSIRANWKDHNADRNDNGAPIGASNPLGRNLRNVWHLNHEPFPGAHFATMPPTLAERCIKAGTSEKGQCPCCGAPWARLVERQTFDRTTDRLYGGTLGNNPSGTVPGSNTRGMPDPQPVTTGWAPSCACPEHMPVPQTVLDPFAGAGTSLLVADRLQRHGIGIELNPEYAALAHQRLISDAPLFAEFAA